MATLLVRLNLAVGWLGVGLSSSAAFDRADSVPQRAGRLQSADAAAPLSHGWGFSVRGGGDAQITVQGLPH